MSATATSVTTAGITPEFFPEQMVRSSSRIVVVAALVLVTLCGLGLRAYRLDAEGLSEDELNKVRAVEDYRTRGITSANGEHPFLMKALMTLSIVGVERWNASSFAAAHPERRLAVEASARLPVVLFGTLTSVLIFFVVVELFGVPVALTAAALWAFDPSAIGFNRIAKEDSFLLFFFLLANVFWLRGQRVAEAGGAHPTRYYWATAAAFGAMLASKYMPHFLAISGAYYYTFQMIPGTRWRMGKRRWLLFFVVMGAAFLVCNPTILLPATWHEMRVFAGERRIGHDSYEFLGTLYRNQMTLWLKGSPWYFYYVFMGVKIPLLTLAAFVAGLPLLFTRRLGDGRYFVLWWMFFWFFPFTVLGGKFTRYFTFALPVVLITAAVGINWTSQRLARLVERFDANPSLTSFARGVVLVVVLACSCYASASAAPFYRLYTNAPGGGDARAGTYFPHDEFYDASMRETVRALVPLARAGARVASETPEVVNYYARQTGRGDLVSISLSDRAAVSALAPGDVIIVARGRRYFSNDALVAALRAASSPQAKIALGDVQATEVFVLDEASREAISRRIKE